MGLYCRYDGKTLRLDELEALMEKYRLIPICPEIMGGLGTPRNPCERRGDKVIDCSGKDVTGYFDKGAIEALKLARLYDCEYAILKERSPSCGYGRVYDGSFSGTLINGNGVTAELLAENGLTILGETQVGCALDI